MSELTVSFSTIQPIAGQPYYFRIDLIKLTLHNLLMDAFQALADPTRRAIITMLAPGERSAGDIGAAFDMSAPAISQHLKTLRDAGLIQVRVDAQRRIYSLDSAGFGEIDHWLAHIRSFWSTRLDILERELRKPERKRKPRSSRKPGESHE